MTTLSQHLDLFATPVRFYQDPDADVRCESLQKLFLNIADKEGDAYRDKIDRDTQNGELYESNFDLFRWNKPELNGLWDQCHFAVKDTVESLSNYSEEQMDRLQFDYDAWFHITGKGGYQGIHNHPNATWSCIYCVHPGEQSEVVSGEVRFHDPRSCSGYYRDSGNTELTRTWSHDPIDIQHKAGQMVVFPSWLLHEIFPFTGQDPKRIVVAMNVMVRTKPGAGAPERV